MNSPTETHWLIVGLGNPGDRYARSRHNLGFMVVDALAGRLQAQVKREECRALIGRARIGGEVVELAKPQTFMNLSGESVACLLKKGDRDVGRMVVIVDDLALPLGRIRIRRKGSDGGHNGLKSLSACLKTEEFIRLRIGIRPEHPMADTKGFVLENFRAKDLDTVEETIRLAADAVISIVTEGVQRAMGEYNSGITPDDEN